MNRPLTAAGLNLLLAFLLAFGSSCQPDDRAVFTAAEKGDLARVKSIVEKRPELKDARDDKGRTPLYYAARNGDLEMVRYLADAGAEVGAVDRDGFSALHMAAIRCHPGVVKYLHEHGADPKSRSRTGGFSPLIGAAGSGCLDTVKYLLDQGVDANETNDNGQTPLQAAAFDGDPKVVELLLDRGARIDDADHQVGWTALHQAARRGHEEVVKLLLERGAKTDVKDKIDNSTPLMLAEEEGETRTAALLRRAQP